VFTFKAFPAIVPLAGRSARRLGPKQALGEINQKENYPTEIPHQGYGINS
jgi:hypothetical protein